VVGEVNKTLSSRTKAWDSGEATIVSESRILFYQNDNEVFSTINITSRPYNHEPDPSSAFLYNMYLISAPCVCAERQEFIWMD